MLSITVTFFDFIIIYPMLSVTDAVKIKQIKPAPNANIELVRSVRNKVVAELRKLIDPLPEFCFSKQSCTAQQQVCIVLS